MSTLGIKARRVFTTIALVISLGAVPIASSLAQEKSVQSEVIDVIEALKGYSAEQRDEALAAAKHAIADLDVRIAKAERQIAENWQNMSAAAREESTESLQRLRKGRQQLSEWYGGMKHSSSKAWGHVKKGFSKAYSSLRDAWSEASKEFNSEK